MVLANKNNKEYRISEEEYNGLAMVDDIAPVILLNPVSSIRNKRRIFTLMHELAHLFLGVNRQYQPLIFITTILIPKKKGRKDGVTK